jgi:AcrR family transcriptional regulator
MDGQNGLSFAAGFDLSLREIGLGRRLIAGFARPDGERKGGFNMLQTGQIAGQNPSPVPLPTRQRLIEAASRLFCRYGINAVGVDAIVSEAGTAKATLYKLFGSKERLVEAVLDHEGREWRAWFLGALHKGEASPLQKMQRIFPLLREWFASDRFYGCPFINAVGEHDKRDNRLRALTLQHKRVVVAAIAELADEAGLAEPEQVAHQFALLIDGAIVAAMVLDDPGVADLGAGMASRLLGSLPTAQL